MKYSFVYPQVVSEYYDNGTLKTEYHRGLGLISMEESGGSEHFYRYDALGSVRALSDGGSVTDTYDYDPYGKVLPRTGTTDNSFMFTGEQYDDETGNYYLRARYYNPTAGNFTARDSYEGDDRNPITLNKYAYANANPVMYTDPSGHFGIMELSAIQSVIDEMSKTAMGMYPNIPTPEQTMDVDGKKLFNNRYYTLEYHAAWDATNKINTVSINENKEYGGWVMQLKGSIGLFYAIEPSVGTADGNHWDPEPNRPNKNNIESAIYHTHGKIQTELDWFSHCKNNPLATKCKVPYGDSFELFSEGDISTLNHYHVNGYLGTPRGWFWEYNYQNGNKNIHSEFPRVSSPDYAKEAWLW